MTSFSIWHFIIFAGIAFAIYRIGKTMRKPSNSDRTKADALLRESELIVNAYGKTLEYLSPSPLYVADENKLPFPKEQVKSALLLMLHVTADEKKRESLKVGYLMLADFQPDVGDKDIGVNVDDLVNSASMSTEELLASAKRFTETMDGSDKWRARADSERAKLNEELKVAGF